MQNKNKRDGMPTRRSLFWDVDSKAIDPEKHKRYIIERILEYGTDDEVRWAWRKYGEATLRDVAQHSRALRPKSKALWLLLTATQ